jgi:hypothetical protein
MINAKKYMSVRSTLHRLIQQATSTSTSRAQSTSTMAIVNSVNPGTVVEKTSTLSFPERKDFSTAMTPYEVDTEVQQYQSIIDNSTRVSKAVVGVEMDISQVATVAQETNSFDKILLLVSHGEAQASSDSTIIQTMGDISLTGRGVGQALDVSRTTAMYCDKQKGLLPELFVVSPLRCTTESALLAFPLYGPDSIYGMPWVCRHDCVDIPRDSTSESDLKTSLPGIDYSSLHSESESGSDSTQDFLTWLQGRDEKVIVVSTTASWIQSFSERIEMNSSNHVHQQEKRRKGLRTFGVKFN